MNKRKLAIVTILAILLTVAYYWNAGRVSADIEWAYIPAIEVSIIENVDFLHTAAGICWGITYNPTSTTLETAWTVEVITGEYDIERVNNMVDFSDPIGCKRIL